MKRRGKPTVALVAHQIHDHGGMERAFAELIRRGHERYDFVVVAVALDEELRPLVRWHRVRVPLRPVTVLLPLFFLTAGIRLFRIPVDLVHTLGAIVPNRADLATVQFCQAGHRELTGTFAPPGARPLRRLNTTLARRMGLAGERWCYRAGRVGSLATVSAGVAAEVRRHYPGLPLVLTPNGVDIDRFHPALDVRKTVRNEHGIKDGEVVALFLGGEWDRKGLDLAIAGIAEAQRRTSKSLRLWVVGRGDERRFGALARRLGIADCVTFMGLRSATERFYQAADLFVIPTLYETFSLAAHEAAAVGLPVVGTNVSGVDELLAGGAAGVLVDRNASAVGAAITLLAEDDRLRRRLGASGRARVSTLTWDRAVDSVLKAYDAILQSPSVDARRPALAGTGAS